MLCATAMLHFILNSYTSSKHLCLYSHRCMQFKTSKLVLVPCTDVRTVSDWCKIGFEVGLAHRQSLKIWLQG